MAVDEVRRFDSERRSIAATGKPMRARIADLHARRAAAAIGGPERARRLHKERKQLLPRERIAALMDPGSPFLEFCQLAGEGMYEGVPPGGSIITGVGMVSGRACMIIANDATVKGGTYYGITCKKHVRAQRFAWQHRLPCVTLVQSGGANLPDQPNIFPDEGQFGSIFYNQIRMSSEGIPQIAVVHGPSTAGGAYMPALCDETVIVRNQGAMFLGGPQLVYAATKEEVGMEALGGGEMHSRVSGVTDHLAESDSHAIAITRDIVAHLGEIPAAAVDRGPAAPAARRSQRNLRADQRRSARADQQPRYRRAPRRRQRVPRVQAAVRRYADHRLRPHHGIRNRDPLQQRRAVLGKRAESHTLHRSLLQAQHPAAVHGRRNRFHGRARGGRRRHLQARRQDDHGDGQRQRAEIHTDHRQCLRRRISLRCAAAPSGRTR